MILRGGMLGGERRLPASDTEAVRWSKERLYLVETEMEDVNANVNANAVVYGMRMEWRGYKCECRKPKNKWKIDKSCARWDGVQRKQRSQRQSPRRANYRAATNVHPHFPSRIFHFKASQVFCAGEVDWLGC
jgi:hypothetical protein